MKQIMVLVLLLFVVGCKSATTSSLVGSGPITLSASAQKSYEKYLKSNPRAFAVTNDGRTSWGWYYCRDIQCRGTKLQSMPKAIKVCQKYSNGKPCRIYDIGGKIVWDQNVKPEKEIKVDLYDPKKFEISDGQKTAFGRYLDLVSIKDSDINLAFAISKDGHTARSRSKEIAPYNKLKQTVLEICRAKSSDEECVLYAINDKVVTEK
ncbi:hypothetical protein [Kiloniella antarctica]|uniref:DUF4189 domain-containing protein n=1 Tax=Kiloniella antarctica TaxID=1550907 RepID=A0ABW5BHE9_9PROT